MVQQSGEDLNRIIGTKASSLASRLQDLIDELGRVTEELDDVVKLAAVAQIQRDSIEKE